MLMTVGTDIPDWIKIAAVDAYLRNLKQPIHLFYHPKLCLAISRYEKVRGNIPQFRNRNHYYYLGCFHNTDCKTLIDELVFALEQNK